MNKKIKKILFCLLISLFVSIGTTITYADEEEFFIDYDIYNKPFSDWNQEIVYHVDDIVQYNYKIYITTKTSVGDVPGVAENWICKANLSCLNDITFVAVRV